MNVEFWVGKKCIKTGDTSFVPRRNDYYEFENVRYRVLFVSIESSLIRVGLCDLNSAFGLIEYPGPEMTFADEVRSLMEGWYDVDSHDIDEKKVKMIEKYFDKIMNN